MSHLVRQQVYIALEIKYEKYIKLYRPIMVAHFIYVLIDMLLLINKASNIGIIQQIICIVSQNKRAINFFGRGVSNLPKSQHQ